MGTAQSQSSSTDIRVIHKILATPTDRRTRVQCVRERVSKLVTNGRKRAVLDVVGFICVSQGSSTVELHNSLGSRRAYACLEAGFSSQNGDRAWGLYYRRTVFSREIFVSKRIKCKKYSQKKCFLFTV
jgi:hypothetical protein